MTTDTVTYLILGFPPRRIRREFPANTPGTLIVTHAPKGAFAYLTPDGVTHYIDAMAIERVFLKAHIKLVRSIITETAKQYR